MAGQRYITAPRKKELPAIQTEALDFYAIYIMHSITLQIKSLDIFFKTFIIILVFGKTRWTRDSRGMTRKRTSQNGGKMEGKEQDRKWEEKHLEECKEIIRKNVESYENEIRVMSADIQEMYERYRSDDPEIFTELSNTITMHENWKLAFEKNRRALKKPYFGRIDVREGQREEETFYLGKCGVMKDATNILIVDWRAPIANVYYENGLGECTYQVPGEKQITVDLRRKRTYEIADGRLLDYYDSEVVANDELLTKYLAKNKEAVLGEIIATIQKEQNEIIRKSPYRNSIVQGVAGSGKTTVAMHRISYILYNYEKDFRPEDFYIIGSNRILLNYITGVLPELDVHGVRQMTMEQLFARLLYEDWEEKRYQIIPCTPDSFRKGTEEWFRALERFARRKEREVVPDQDVLFGELPLLTREQIDRYLRENPRSSAQSKINMLNERCLARLKNELTGREISYTAEERRELLRRYTGVMGGKKWKVPIPKLYDEFLTEMGVLPPAKEKRRKVDVYDLAALAYLYKRMKETDPIREAHHIVIDEAQDFGMMAYEVLHFCIPGCSYTVMGDVSQNIRFGSGLNDWEELKRLLLTDRADSFALLSKSYRNTVEISEFAQGILRHGSFSQYPIEPIIRHGSKVELRSCGKEECIAVAADRLHRWRESGYDTIAVICRTEQEAAETARQLAERIPVEESNPEIAKFKSGIMVLPVEYTKGLEFDAVLLYCPTREDYPEEDGHAKLLYVAATRALHELAVVHCENLTALIGKPQPSR